MTSFWKSLAETLERGQSAFLVLVARNSPGSPGTAGAKMFVTSDGVQCGTIGGGLMELNLVKRAQEEFARESVSADQQTLHHRRSGPGDKSGLICAGNQTNVYVLCRPDRHTEVVRGIAEATEKDMSSVLTITADVFDFEPRVLDLQDLAVRIRENDETWRYEEQLLNRKRIAIIGGGHCGRALSRSMANIGYEVSVFDTRENVETFVNNPYAKRKVTVDDYGDAGAQIAFPECTRVVVMTTDYPSDVKALRGAFKFPFPFVGVMGSAAKIAQVRSELKADGFSEKALSRLYAPVGLKIHSHTPEEIAISIAAQLISLQGEIGK